MDYLAREGAPISADMWEKIDAAVIDNAKKHLVCRRFLSLYGPLGAGTYAVAVDSADKDEEFQNGLGRITGRRMAELPQLYQDFALLWRDIEDSEKQGYPLDLSAAAAAAQRSAKQEDDLILFGSKELGAEGLFNASGAFKIKRSDWSEGEGAYKDVAHGISYLSSNSMLGRYALVLSPELYLELERLQPNVGLLELDRIAKLVGGRVYPAGSYGAGKAALVCAEPQYMDLAVGADLSVGYLEQKDFNHYFRIMETAALRIKQPKAIVVFE
ncbi:family 1 encapsulin nanocompartment shell protein [Clostridium sp. AN503]|uniref:family 1 encapsulin nanocompartment shell protein n=1 Tax=Clostridium sp. AN503 TaxID=3160598 RepID=UPI00345B456A